MKENIQPCWKFRERDDEHEKAVELNKHRASTWCSGFSIFYHTTSSCWCKRKFRMWEKYEFVPRKYENMRIVVIVSCESHEQRSSHSEWRRYILEICMEWDEKWATRKIEIAFHMYEIPLGLEGTHTQHMKVDKNKNGNIPLRLNNVHWENWENCELTILHVPLLWSSCFLPRSCLAHNFRHFMAFLSLRGTTRDNCKKSNFLTTLYESARLLILSNMRWTFDCLIFTQLIANLSFKCESSPVQVSEFQVLSTKICAFISWEQSVPCCRLSLQQAESNVFHVLAISLLLQSLLWVAISVVSTPYNSQQRLFSDSRSARQQHSTSKNEGCDCERRMSREEITFFFAYLRLVPVAELSSSLLYISSSSFAFFFTPQNIFTRYF